MADHPSLPGRDPRGRHRFLTRRPFLASLLLAGPLAELLPITRAEEANTPDVPELTLARDGHWLVIKSDRIPAGEIRVNYLEAYCRGGSTDADWIAHTVIPHRNALVALSGDGKELQLRDTLEDGVTVDHTITARTGDVRFELVARNPTAKASEAQWAQPCVRLGAFTGFAPSGGDLDDYLPKCFLFLDGKLARMPTPVWEKKARYIPGQVWCPAGVPRTDVNPRPLSKSVPSNGLIGCVSGDGAFLFATAWEPYQELFQGVARCLHSDFRIGGLDPGETKRIRGRIYILPNDVSALLRRFQGNITAFSDPAPPRPPWHGVFHARV